MDRKKKRFLWAAVTAVILAVCVGFLAVSSLDSITSTEVEELVTGYPYYRIIHTFKNGKTVEVGARVEDIMLDDNVHMLIIRVGKDMTTVDGVPASDASYNLSNLRFEAHLEDKNGGRVLCPHSCADGGTGTSAEVKFDSQSISKISANGSAEGDFIYATFIVQGDFEIVDLDVSYDLDGRGMRLGSRFEEQKTNIKIGRKAPPYGDEAEK